MTVKISLRLTPRYGGTWSLGFYSVGVLLDVQNLNTLEGNAMRLYFEFRNLLVNLNILSLIV